MQDNGTDAIDRLEAALERIAIAGPPTAPKLAARLDTLIGQLRDALAHSPQ